MWAKARRALVYGDGIGEYGPIGRKVLFELAGNDLRELERRLAFDLPESRYRTMDLGTYAFELRGRLFGVGAFGVGRAGFLRVVGWASDVPLRDVGALFEWLEGKRGAAGG
jgi:hypothetical protein